MSYVNEFSVMGDVLEERTLWEYIDHIAPSRKLLECT